MRFVRSDTYQYVTTMARYTIYLTLVVVVSVIISSRYAHGSTMESHKQHTANTDHPNAMKQNGKFKSVPLKILDKMKSGSNNTESHSSNNKENDTINNTSELGTQLMFLDSITSILDNDELNMSTELNSTAQLMSDYPPRDVKLVNMHELKGWNLKQFHKCYINFDTSSEIENLTDLTPASTANTYEDPDVLTGPLKSLFISKQSETTDNSNRINNNKVETRTDPTFANYTNTLEKNNSEMRKTPDSNDTESIQVNQWSESNNSSDELLSHYNINVTESNIKKDKSLTSNPNNKDVDKALQKLCANQNTNSEIAFTNDENLKQAYLTLNSQQVLLEEALNQHINFTDVFSRYDKAFKEMTLKKQNALAQQFQSVVSGLREAMVFIEKHEQHVSGRITQVQADMEDLKQTIGFYEENKKSPINSVSIKSPGYDRSTKNPDYLVTNRTCNAKRRHLLGNSCYYIPQIQTENQLFSWWDARYHCKEVLGERADLVVLDSKTEMYDLTMLLRTHFGDIDEFWLGASNLHSVNGRRWNWVNGETLNRNTLSDWGSTLILHNENNCMAMYGSFQFHGEPCFYERFPACEIKFE